MLRVLTSQGSYQSAASACRRYIQVNGKHLRRSARAARPREGKRSVGVSWYRRSRVGDFENLKSSPIEEVLENFHVTRDQIQTVLDFAARVGSPGHSPQLHQITGQEH